MDPIAQQSPDLQQQYWNEMVKPKISHSYICLYRDYLSRWVTTLGVIKAVASSVSIAAWAIWQRYSFVWGCIIAISQVADALKDVFPFTRKHKAASEHAVALDTLFIDAQLEWDNIFFGKYTGEQISSRLHKLRKLQHEAERRAFPEGLAYRKGLFIRAQTDAKAHFTITYGIQ